MITKTKLISILENLPENITIDQLLDNIIFAEKVEKGLADVEEGKVFTKEEARKKLSKWLS